MLKREFDGSLLLQLDGSDTVYDSWVETLCFNYDFLPVGEEYCIGNYGVGCDLQFNGGSDYVSINSYQIAKFLKGEEIRLVPCLDEYVKEMMPVWYKEVV